MIAESQIRAKLGRYLRNEIPLDVFEDWLVQKSWNMHQDSDEQSQKLASAIELRLAEHSSGHLDEALLRDQLRSFVGPSMVQVSFGNATVAAPSAPSEEPPNNVIAKPNSQVIVFTAQGPQSSETLRVASGFAGTKQLVAHE